MTEARTVSHFACNVRVVLSFTANLEIFHGNLGKVLRGSEGNTGLQTACSLPARWQAKGV